MMQQTENRISDNDTLTEQIIGAAIQVHRELGPGLLESAYEVCLCHELSLSGLKIERQKIIPISYKDIKLDAGYSLDLVVEGQVIVESKLSLSCYLFMKHSFCPI